MIANPAAGVARSQSLKPRERHWGPDDARALYTALANGTAPVEPVTALLLRFIALTLVRRDEARLAQWREVDFSAGTWTIPNERMKNGRAHVVPLAPEAAAVLKAAAEHSECRPEDYIFPSSRSGGEPLHRDAPYLAWRRTCDALGVPRGGNHDWRRTGSTILTSERLKVRRFFVSMLLAHTPSDGARVTAFYDRNEYLLEKRQALELWGAWLAGATSHSQCD